MIDISNSLGNYFVDVSGNTVLDLNASATGQILGYNHKDYFFWTFNSLSKLGPKRASRNMLPANDVQDLVFENVMAYAPVGQTYAYFAAATSATAANELAASVAI